jgi:hypothetical protein
MTCKLTKIFHIQFPQNIREASMDYPDSFMDGLMQIGFYFQLIRLKADSPGSSCLNSAVLNFKEITAGA